MTATGSNEVETTGRKPTGGRRQGVMMRAVAVALAVSFTWSAIPTAAAPLHTGVADGTEGTVSGPPVPPALAGLHPGQRIRIATVGSQPVEGRLVAVRDGRLLLDGSLGSVPIDAIEKVWVRRGDPKGGALGLGVLGALVGGALAGLIVGADSATRTPGNVSRGVAVGAAVCGTLGAVAGGAIGTSVPRWDILYGSERAQVRQDEEERAATTPPSPAPPAAPLVAPPPPQGDLIGSASLHLAYNKALDSIAASGGLGGRLSVEAEREGLRPGFEIGRYGLGSREIVTIRDEHLRYDESLLHIGPTLSFGPSHGRLRPYAIAGLGFYRWQSYHPTPHESEEGIDRSDLGITPLDEQDPAMIDQAYDTYDPVQRNNFLGGSLGGGVTFQPTRTLSLGAEGRWHTNLTSGPWMSYAQPSRRLSLLTVTAGATIRW